MIRLFRLLLPVAIYVHLLMCGDPGPRQEINEPCLEGNSIEVHVRNVEDFKKQLQSGYLHDFLMKKIEEAGNKVDVESCHRDITKSSAALSTRRYLHTVGVTSSSMDFSMSQEQTEGMKRSDAMTETRTPSMAEEMTVSKSTTETDAMTNTVSTAITDGNIDTTSSQVSDGMTTAGQLATTTEETTDSMSLQESDRMTTIGQRASTSEETPDSLNSDSFTTDDIRSTMPTCPPAESNGDCKLIYDRKCFTWVKGSQIYDLAKANETCLGMGFQLGNIYDDCHNKQILKKLPSPSLFEVFSFRTGMTIEFAPGTENVYLSSGEKTNVKSSWWFKEYPQLDVNFGLITIAVRGPIPSSSEISMGIKNDIDAPLNGVFCEKGA